MSGLKIKVILGKDIRLFRYDPSSNIYDALLNYVSTAFDLKNFQMVYEDSEGDKITIFDINDFKEAFEAAQNEKKKSLKIYIRPKDEINDNHNDNKNENKNNENEPNWNGCNGNWWQNKDFPKMIPEFLKQFGVKTDEKKAEEFFANLLKNCHSNQNSPFAAFMKQPWFNNNNENNQNDENDVGNNNNNNNYNNYNWHNWHNWKNHCQPSALSAEFVKSISIPDGSYYPQDTMLTKVWKIRNNGTENWGNSVFLVFFKGNQSLTLESKYPVQNDVKPGQTINVSAMIHTPAKEGRYVCYFRLKKNGNFFGPKMWCDIFVINDIEKDEEQKDNKNKELKKKKRELNKNIDLKQLKFDKKNEKFERQQSKLKGRTSQLQQELIKTNEEILKLDQNNNNNNNNNNGNDEMVNDNDNKRKNGESLLKKQIKIKEKLNKIETKIKAMEEKQKNFLEKENEKQTKKNKKAEKQKEKKQRKEKKQKAKKEKAKAKKENMNNDNNNMNSDDMVQCSSDSDSDSDIYSDSDALVVNDAVNNEGQQSDNFKFSKELDVIKNMGFMNDVRIRELLLQKNGNIYAVIQQLLQQN